MEAVILPLSSTALSVMWTPHFVPGYSELGGTAAAKNNHERRESLHLLSSILRILQLPNTCMHACRQAGTLMINFQSKKARLQFTVKPIYAGVKFLYSYHLYTSLGTEAIFQRELLRLPACSDSAK